MADDTRAEDVEEQTQPEPVPSSDQKLPETPVTDSPEKAESEQKPAEGADLELPEGTKDRTKEQFDKLKERLKASEEKLKQMGTPDRIFDTVPSAQPGYKPTPTQVNQFVDPKTGVVDINGLNSAIATTQRQSQQALQVARRAEEQRQETEAYGTYPELSPKAKGHDRKLYQQTRAVLLDSMVNPQDYGGSQLTLKQAADFAKGPQAKATEDGQKKGAKQAMEQLTAKEQASLEATGRSDRRQDLGDQDQLAQATRRGDIDAIVARLKKLE